MAVAPVSLTIGHSLAYYLFIYFTLLCGNRKVAATPPPPDARWLMILYCKLCNSAKLAGPTLIYVTFSIDEVMQDEAARRGGYQSTRCYLFLSHERDNVVP